MKYKTLFRLAIKAIGVFLAIEGATGFLGFLGWYATVPSGGSKWDHTLGFIRQAAVPSFKCAIGLYLFWGGRWIVNLAIPSNRPYCPECAYDLTGAQMERCPECGTAFRWEDVKPKTKD